MSEKRELLLGDILKSEADPNSREMVLGADIKIGDLVMYMPRNEPLVALSDSVGGKVLVQPWNCVINLAALSKKAIEAFEVESPVQDGVPKKEKMTVDRLKMIGDQHGIKYVGEPQ